MLERIWNMLAEKGLAFATAAGAVILGFRWCWIRLGKLEKGEEEPETGGALGCDKCARFDQRLTPADLATHRFFAFMRHSRLVTIPTLPIREAGRKALAVDLLMAKFRAAEEIMAQWVERPDLDTMCDAELVDGLLCAINDIIMRYEAEAMVVANAKNGVPAMYVYLGRFRELHASTVEQVRDWIDATCPSGWLGHDSMAKTAAVLDYLVSVFRRTLADAERTMGRLNGSLSGLPYGGVIIGPCPNSLYGTTPAPDDSTQDKWKQMAAKLKEQP